MAPESFSFEKEIGLKPDPIFSDINEAPSFTSHDGTVQYYLPSEISIALSGYPIITVSPHQFTVEEAKDLAKELFHDAPHYEYKYNRPLTEDEIQDNLSRWDSYLNEGTIYDLVHGDEILVNDYQEVLNRFKENYASSSSIVQSRYTPAPCDWTFHPDSYYYGESFAEKDASSIRTIVTSEGVDYQFNVFRRAGADFTVNSIYAHLYSEVSPNNIDSLLQQYNLCKSSEPTAVKLDSISKRALKILNTLNVGEWTLDSCKVERHPGGVEEAYIVTVKAAPVLAGFSVTRQPQLSTLRSKNENAQHYYYPDATFSFAPSGTLLSFSLQSPIDVVAIQENIEVMDTEKLIHTAENLLSEHSVSDFSAYFIPQPTPDLKAKVSIERILVGLSRIEIKNGREYQYVPSICVDARIEFYDNDGFVLDSTSDGNRRILVLNATNGSKITVGETEFVRLDD